MKIFVKIVAKDLHVAQRSNDLIPATPNSDGEMSVHALQTLMQKFDKFGASASIVPSPSSSSSASQSPITKQAASTSTSAQFRNQQQQVNSQINHNISHTLPTPKQDENFIEIGKLQIHQRSINTDSYNLLVKVIPDREFTIFTPLLLSTATGVVPLLFTVTQQPCEFLVHLPQLNTTQVTLNITACKHDEDDYFCFSEYSNNLTLYSASPHAQDDSSSTSTNQESQQQQQKQSSADKSQAGNTHHL